jgi:ATP-binding cassette, subfamily F, member 3
MSSVREVLASVLTSADDDTLEYFEGMISSDDGMDETTMYETLPGFIVGYGIADSEEDAIALVKEICDNLKNIGIKNEDRTAADPKLLDGVINIKEKSKNMISESEQASIDTMWGFDKIRQKKNEVIEMTEAGSAKFERRMVQDQKQWLESLEAKFVGEEEDNTQISAMTLPTLDGKSNEKDIHVHNFTITFGGKVLLDGADLRLVCGRRYGLVGRNGIGKTTLLKHMASFDIEGFPTHHRVLHVKQEVKTSELSVLQVLSLTIEQP